MIKYMQCPYCDPFSGGHTKKVPKTIGKFRVKQMDHILIFQCQRCLKTFRVRMMGAILMWGDMTHDERQTFKVAKWNKKKKGEANGRNK